MKRILPDNSRPTAPSLQTEKTEIHKKKRNGAKQTKNAAHVFEKRTFTTQKTRTTKRKQDRKKLKKKERIPNYYLNGNALED